MNLADLKKPFDPDRVSWRIGVAKTGDGGDMRGLALAYLDARDVQDRLDEVCGIAGWQCRYSLQGETTICEIGVKVGDEWIWKADGAGATDVEAEKGALSSAFKRAAVKFGVGRYLYDIESPWVRIEPLYPNSKQTKIAASEKARLRKILDGGAKVTMREQKEVERKSEAGQWTDTQIEILFNYSKSAEVDAWADRCEAALIRLKEVSPADHERLMDKLQLRYEQLGSAAA